MLKSALNALTRIHSRTATLKRLGTVDNYSPCRITPSNYFRFLRGPEYTTIRGVEFVIPIDSMTGHFAQKLSFSAIPDSGEFKIRFESNTTAALQFDATAADIQTELRLISGLENVVVTGSFLLGFTITFVGFQVAPALGQVVDTTLKEGLNNVDASWINTSVRWLEPLKKGDRILDGTRIWVADEIMEMHDMGAQIMAYRVRAD